MSRNHEDVHVPVLVPSVLEALAGGRGPEEVEGLVLDATLGAGGHARAILEAFPGVELLGADQDPYALELAERNLAPFSARTLIRRARISALPALLQSEGIAGVDAILFDLGASSMQFDRPERGFSVQADGPLDMRMDPTRQRTAAEIVNQWDEADLADLFYYEGGERQSRRIAAAIVEGRRRAPFLRTAALAQLVAQALAGREGRIHPATRVVQALRRAVNEEGEELIHGLELAQEMLVEGGRLVALTFHSGEDGIVKRFLSKGKREGRWELINKKPIGPTQHERLANPRARSARLRAGARLRNALAHRSRFRGGRP